MKLFRPYLVLALALLITLSATGISISLHKCCGTIQGFSLFGNHEECEMAKKPASQDCPVKSLSNIQKQPCCDNQQISFQSLEKSYSAAAKIQVKESEQNFDVLFFYTLFKNWFGSSETEDNAEKPSPGLFITEAIILLLQQFRI